MLRGIIALNGLIIDVDSFSLNSISEWAGIVLIKRCLFITKKQQVLRQIRSIYPSALATAVLATEVIEPNHNSLCNYLEILELPLSQTAYVTADIEKLKNLMSFYVGSILVISRQLTYDELSRCPDILVNDIQQLESIIPADHIGFFGEISASPFASKGSFRTSYIRTKCDCYGKSLLIFATGRYYGSKTYCVNTHALSAKILRNKSNGKAFLSANRFFCEQYSSLIKRIGKENIFIDAIVSVPQKPKQIRNGEKDRFADITKYLTEEHNIKNASSEFVCIKDYESQKTLSFSERLENIKGKFKFVGRIDGQTIAIVDDVMTSSATVTECADTLYKAGAKSVIVLVIGINQKITYWSTNWPSNLCSSCNHQMNILMNSSDLKLFYSCSNWKLCSEPQSYNFNVGYEKIIKMSDDSMRNEFSLDEDESWL